MDQPWGGLGEPGLPASSLHGPSSVLLCSAEHRSRQALTPPSKLDTPSRLSALPHHSFQFALFQLGRHRGQEGAGKRVFREAGKC